MPGPNSSARIRLLDALHREGIDCPAHRLDDTVEDFSHLQAFMELVRAELRRIESVRDE